MPSRLFPDQKNPTPSKATQGGQAWSTWTDRDPQAQPANTPAERQGAARPERDIKPARGRPPLTFPGRGKS
jgi:hypothetical protein